MPEAASQTELQFRAMGCPCRIWLQGDDWGAAAEAARGEIQRLESKYSRYLPASVVSRINAAAGSGDWVEIDEETERLLDYADVAWQQSQGRFDITSGILRQVWDFRAGQLPAAAAVRSLLARIDWSLVQRAAGRVRLPQAGMELDFGGFGKEYAADAAASVLRKAGCHSGLVDLGGDIVILGAQADGSAWSVGISDPGAPQHPVTRLAMRNGALATSGNYQRYMDVDGRRYCHLLDARTGWPLSDALAAVSVVADQCLIAGTAATVAMLQPADLALQWLEELGLPYLAISQQGRCNGPLSAQQSEIASLLVTNR